MSLAEKALLSVVLVAPLAIACSGDRGENEARLFLDRVELVVLETPVAERERMLGALESLPLENEDVIAVREACVDGHRALIEAEVAQREATVELGRATGGRDDVRIPSEEAARIQAMIDRSNEALEESEASAEGTRQ